MRIVTWNMGCGPRSKYRRTHAEAWSYLLGELKPDVALVQEALFSAEEVVGPKGHLLWSQDRGSDNGTALFVAKGLPHEPQVSKVEGSYVASATVTFGPKRVEVISVHVGPPDYRKNLLALRDWLRQRVAASHELIIGGDLNSSRQLNTWHRAYLDELPAVGLHDCHWALHGSEAHSFWGHQAKHLTLQDDHIFTSPTLASAVSGCCVVKNSMTLAFSDHGPLVLDLDVSAPALANSGLQQAKAPGDS